MQESTEIAAASCSIPTLSTHLKNLSITINYLSAMSKYDTEQSLIEFMTSTVGTTPDYLRVDVCVKHIIHVWTILKFAQINALMRSKQVKLMLKYHMRCYTRIHDIAS